jgi:hypothetical protein
MRVASPRLVVIDNDAKHLRGLGDCLARWGAACLQILFTGEPDGTVCPDMRVIFADLHLNEGGGTDAGPRDFSTIGGVLSTLAPTGPYFIVLWTNYPEHAQALKTYLDANLEGVPKPFDVVSLNKLDHLTEDGTVRDADGLLTAVRAMVEAQPQIAALLNWEEHILVAAAATVRSIVESTAGDADVAGKLKRLLARLAVEAVGREHVEKNRFGAVNEVLQAILADRIAAAASSGGDPGVWGRAFDAADVNAAFSLEDAARLNKTVHIADDAVQASVRGAVARLSSIAAIRPFEETFGIAAASAAEREFWCGNFAADNASFRWLLIQTQAICDFAQSKKGTLPFLLALEMPAAALRQSQLKKAYRPAVWVSPPLLLGGQVKYLCASFRFGVALAPSHCAVDAEYRLRDQLITDLAYDAHTYAARPGVLGFREV